MEIIQAIVAPFIDTLFYVTSVWWEEPRLHRGLDIATGRNDSVYSMTSGTVVRADYSTSYGNVVIIKDENGMGYLYAHLRDTPLVRVRRKCSKKSANRNRRKYWR